MVEDCDVDEFIVLYIKTQIEHDAKYEWYEAPAIGSSRDCDKCATVRRAAEYFERRKIAAIKPLLNGLIDKDRLTYQGYRYIFDTFISLLSERMGSEATSDSTSEYSGLCFPLMAIISFTGIYARRLAELDFDDLQTKDDSSDQPDDVALRRRDYRREISRLSIYASHTLQSKFAEFKRQYGYPWSKFVEDTRKWLAYAEYCDACRLAASRAQNLVQTGGKLFCAGAAIIIAVLTVRHHGVLTRWF